MENSKRIETLESQISRVHCAIVHIKAQRRSPTPRQATVVSSLTYLLHELVRELEEQTEQPTALPDWRTLMDAEQAVS